RPVLRAESAVLIVPHRSGEEESLIETELLLDVLAECPAFDRFLARRLDRTGIDPRDAGRKDVRRVERSVESIANKLNADRRLRFDAPCQQMRGGGAEIRRVFRARELVDRAQSLPIQIADRTPFARGVVRLVLIAEIIQADRAARREEAPRPPVALETVGE